MRRVRTEEVELKVKELYEGGAKATQIAKQTGIGKTTVYACLKNQDIYTGERIIPKDAIPTIVDMYVKQKIGYVAIATRLGYPKRKVRQAILDSGNEIQKPKQERYQVDEFAFDIIDNELAAYWLGFIYADGCVYKNSLRIDLHKRDAKHLEKIKPFLRTERPLWSSDKRPTKILFQVVNAHLAGRLKQLGILPYRPSISLATTQIPGRLQHHFIRGYCDGDGSVGKSRTRIRICGQDDILQWIWKVSDTTSKFHIEALQNTDAISVLGFYSKYAILFRNYIYKGATVWMERKREKADRW